MVRRHPRCWCFEWFHRSEITRKARDAAKPIGPTKESEGNMNSMVRKFALLAAVVALAFSGAASAETPKSVTGAATITVTAIAKKDAAPPRVAKDDVQLSVNKERKQAAGWSKGDSLALAILIDDSLGTNSASQWNDLKQFIMAQPPNTAIAVAYASNSSAF